MIDGPGVYIFRAAGALKPAANTSVILTNGATAENVFWAPVEATTIGANSTFVGNILDAAGITIGQFSTLLGRALAAGGTVTTDANTITVPTMLRVIKVVDGGTSVFSDFTLHVKSATSTLDVAGSPLAGSATPGTAYTLSVGTYTVSENTNTSYTSAFSGDCNSSGSVTLAVGNSKTCTITNTYVAGASSGRSSIVQYYGKITVVKKVINDNGGTKTISDFPLFVSNVDFPGFVTKTPVVSGNAFSFKASNKYDITETSDPNYIKTFSGDCDVNGRLTLDPDQNKFCIVTNDDIGAPVVVPPVPPLIDLVKVPSPLALPAGPGPVTYTYTLHNIGTVPVTDITLVGDSCSPIKLSAGDTNGNAKLEVNEIWTYRCSTTLSKTHTNTVVATGWANGVSAVDIANATVVVGAPVVPPLIHVTKVPSPLALRSAGGAVTYTYTVTNPGTVPLSNVSITDDKCTGLPGRVVGHPGDLNKNNLLESNETWSFTCKSTLTKTTTNTGTVSGSANGLTAKDLAVATVIVVPGLPNTGFSPEWSNSTWGVIIAIVILAALLFLAKKKKLI